METWGRFAFGKQEALTAHFPTDSIWAGITRME